MTETSWYAVYTAPKSEVRADEELRRLGGYPKWWLEQELRDARKQVDTLDPDIAALQSVSNAAKFNMQVQRRWQENVDMPKRWGARRKAMEAFAKSVGADFIDWTE